MTNTETVETNEEAHIQTKAKYGSEAWAHEVIAVAKRPTTTPEEKKALVEEVWAAVMGNDR